MIDGGTNLTIVTTMSVASTKGQVGILNSRSKYQAARHSRSSIVGVEGK